MLENWKIIDCTSLISGDRFQTCARFWYKECTIIKKLIIIITIIIIIIIIMITIVIITIIVTIVYNNVINMFDVMSCRCVIFRAIAAIIVSY